MTIQNLDQTYTDRFGHEWSIGAEHVRRTRSRITFTCGDLRLIAGEDNTARTTSLTMNEVKEVFCDAERVFVHGGETWYVGYRKRTGRGGQAHAGLVTRFRSADGETRYTRTMLCFRHMPETALCKHLTIAERVRVIPTRE